MHEGVVYTTPTEGNILNDFVFEFLIFGKNVQAQWIGVFLYEVVNVLGFGEGENWRNRSENFLLH